MTARRKPSRSRAALPGEGGPCGRSERNGKSKRSTKKPEAASASDISINSFDWQLAPAPWVRTMALPLGREGRCKNPRMGGSAARSRKGVDISRNGGGGGSRNIQGIENTQVIENSTHQKR